MTTDVCAWHDPITNTVSYVAWDPRTGDAVVIDPLLDYDPVTHRTLPWSRRAIENFVTAKNLKVHYILETDLHVDHLSAARDLRAAWPDARWGAARRTAEVFDLLRSEGAEYPTEWSAENLGVDAWFTGGEELRAGSLTMQVLATPGHTPAGLTYRAGEMLFVGDALATPDSGTARCDSPGGDADELYTSITRTLFDREDGFVVYHGHDHQPGARPPRYRFLLAEHKQSNLHVTLGTRRAEFVTFRRALDRTLKTPGLLGPSLDWNLGAHLVVRPTTDQLIRWF